MSDSVQNLKEINSPTFVDDIYTELTDEFQQIRTCMTMYISKDQTEGALHLLKEIVNNALDECTNVNSPSRKVDITFDEETCEFIIADEGRGIPFDMLVKICMVKHTSTKFDRDKVYSKDQAGRNGLLS